MIFPSSSASSTDAILERVELIGNEQQLESRYLGHSGRWTKATKPQGGGGPQSGYPVANVGTARLAYARAVDADPNDNIK